MNNEKMQNGNSVNLLSHSNRYDSEVNFHKIDKIKAALEELESALGKDVIDAIMRNHKDYWYGTTFLKFLDLHGKLSVKEITKALQLGKLRLVENWYRQALPRPIVTLLTIHYKNFHKLSKQQMAYLFGWGFGDGGLTNELNYYFICGKKHDLLKIDDYLKDQIINIPIFIQENNANNFITLHNGTKKEISGTNSWILYIRDSSFCKLLYALGLPKGEKVLQPTKIPLWIQEGEIQIKKSFLNALFEGELQTHKVQLNTKRNKIDICPVTFGLSKIEKHKQNLLELLEDIRRMLQGFQIVSTVAETPKPSNIRKRDGLTTYSSRFYISISASNTIRFSKHIQFPFNKEKQIAMQKALTEAKRKIGVMKLQVNKYRKALEMFEKGSSIYKISKELNIQWHTANNWLTTKRHLPLLVVKNSYEVSNEI